MRRRAPSSKVRYACLIELRERVCVVSYHPLAHVSYNVGSSPSAVVTFVVELLLTLLLLAGFVRGEMLASADPTDWHFNAKSAAAVFFFCVLVGIISMLEEIVKYRLCLHHQQYDRPVRHAADAVRQERLVLLLSSIMGFGCGWNLFCCFFFSVVLTRFESLRYESVLMESYVSQETRKLTVPNVSFIPQLCRGHIAHFRSRAGADSDLSARARALRLRHKSGHHPRRRGQPSFASTFIAMIRDRDTWLLNQ